MIENLKVCSLSEDKKKEIIKQGKTIQITPNYRRYCYEGIPSRTVSQNCEVYCPEGYQILFYDPNLFRYSQIYTYKNYFDLYLPKSKNIEIDSELIETILNEYDNFPKYTRSEVESLEFLGRQSIIKHFMKLNYRHCADDNSKKKIDDVIRELKDFDKDTLKILLNIARGSKEDWKVVIDFLRLRIVRKKSEKYYINEAELDFQTADKRYLDKEMNKNPNEDLIKMKDKEYKRINMQKQLELNNYIKKTNNDEVRHILYKHLVTAPSGAWEVNLISDNNTLIDELNAYNSNGIFNVLINKLYNFNNKLADIDYYFNENYCNCQTIAELRESFTNQSIDGAYRYRESEENILEWYEKNSVENPDKIKHQSQVFWPIDVNGNELKYLQHWPIVMAEKEE